MNDISNSMQWMLHQSMERAGAGHLVQYVRVGEEHHDVWNGTESTDPQTQSVWGMFIADESAEELRDGVLARVERRVLLVAADRLATPPSRTDRVVDGSTVYAVTHWERDAANAAYRLKLRRVE